MAVEGICDCCGGLTVTAPRASFERAGLAGVSLRAGDYWSFRDSMFANLTSSQHGPLADLRSRDPQVDFSIALIDAWAVTGDILTFYNEWLASETFLETAGDLSSLHLLSQLIGYTPFPGVSASAKLAFTMSESEGAPKAIELPSGVKVQSTPGPDEEAVIFETDEPIAARPAWNAMRPRLGDQQTLATTTRELLLAGTQTGLKPGDGLYFQSDTGSAVFAYVRNVELLPADPIADPDKPDLTRIEIDPIVTAPLASAVTLPPAPPVPTFPAVVAAALGTTVDAEGLDDLLAENAISEEDLIEPISGAGAVPKRVLVFRQSAGTFGKAAPALETLPQSLVGDIPVYGTNTNGDVIIENTVPGPFAGRTKATWADEGTLEYLDTAENYVFLDRVVEGVAAGSAVVLIDGSSWGIYEPVDATETALSEFAISGKSTRLKMPNDNGFGTLTIRGTTAFFDSEWLDLPLRPREDDLRTGDTFVELEGFLPGLQAGQTLALIGTLADGVDAPAIEFAEIATVEHVLDPQGGTRITLASGLAQEFDRRAVRMNANIARATHGETTFEVLGEGGALPPFAKFAAKQGPLTNVSSSEPSGFSPELTLKVNGIEWHRVSDFLDAQPEDRVFKLDRDIDGKPQIGFGDGFAGAIPRNGQDNITIDYRVGTGLGGRVAADQLNILMSRPLGLEDVTNPLPSEGGGNPATVLDLKDNLPLYCRTMDRVVSLSDFADFARGFAGIAKSLAERVMLPGQPAPGVVVTVAGEEGAEVPEDGDLYGFLRNALVDSGIPFARFNLRNYRKRYFRMAAKVKPMADYDPEMVLTEVENALRDAFSFENREFAQSVFASEVLTVIQNVDGVEATLLERLYRSGIPKRRNALLARPATATLGAEMLTLHPQGLEFLELMA